LLNTRQRHIPENTMKSARNLALVTECATTEVAAPPEDATDRDMLVTRLLRHAYELRGLVAERNQILVHLSDTYHEALFQIACAMQPATGRPHVPTCSLTAPAVMYAIGGDASLRRDDRVIDALVALLARVGELCEQSGQGHVETDAPPDLTSH